MKSILVTGGAGYIGSHMVRYLLEKGEKVTIIDNFSRSSKGVIDVLKQFGDLHIAEMDLLDHDKLNDFFNKNRNFDAVFHFAAFSLVDESIRKPELYFYNNIVGSLNLVNQICRVRINNFIFSSTCAVYGESRYLPVDELHPLNPNNPYGESKLAVENILKWMSQKYSLNYLIFRYFNVIGAWPDGKIGYARVPSTHLVQNAVKGALGLCEFKLTYPKVNTPDKSPIRDYIDIMDLVYAHYQGYIYLDKNKNNQIINLGTGKGSSVEEIVLAVENTLKMRFVRSFDTPRVGEYSEIYANYTKAMELLNWKPKRSIDEGIESLVKWYLTHPNGYEK